MKNAQGSVVASFVLSVNASSSAIDNTQGKLNTQRTLTASNFNETKKSGLMSSGGLSVTYGKQVQSSDQGQQQTTAAASTVGSIGGNVSLIAGQTYTQSGSDVLSPEGDIDISAQTVNITEARETGSQRSEQKFKQSGLTVAVTSPVLSALQTIDQQIEAAGNTSSGRIRALASANVGMNLKQGADALKAGQGDAKGQVPTGKKNADGTAEMVDGNAADQVGGVGISVSVGSSSSRSEQSSRADNARGSAVVAGGNISIQAKGAGEDSDLTIQGSTVKAGGQATLKADDEVRLLAAANATQEDSRQSSKSGSVGVAMQLGAGGGGIGVTASASRGTGRGAGTGTTYTNSQVEGQTVQIESGGDTTLKGALVKGERVTATVGGNLTIESLQDTNQYDEKSQQVGGSVMVGAGGSASVNFAKTKIDSDYQSVNEQTAIRAGDGGFQVNVAGKTDLVGGQITSTQAAIDNNQNRYDAQAGTSTRDLHNSASFEAQSVSVSVGTSGGKVAPGGVGFGSDKGSASSVTTAGISGVAGNAAARTGDAETGIGQIFNKEQAQQEVAAQVAITQEFGKQASKAVGDYAKVQYDKAKAAGDTDGMAAWEEGGRNRVALHVLVGGLAGGTPGALGAGAASAAAPQIEALQDQLKTALQDAGVSDSTANVIAGLVGSTTAATIGTVASGGSTAGGATAFNADLNNRQLHPDERRKAAELARKSGGKYTREQIEDALRVASNTATGETAASNMIINPQTDTALGNNPTDPVASTNFDAGAVFTAGEGASVVQVNRDGTPLGAKPVDPALVAYIQANTGGVNSPYTWVMPQPGTSNPNAGLNTIAPNQKGQITAEAAAGLLPAHSEMRTTDQVQRDLDNRICSMAIGSAVNTLVPGALVLKPVVDSLGKITGWVATQAFDQSLAGGSSALVCSN